MNFEILSLKINSIIVITLNGKDVPASCRDSCSKKTADNIKKSLNGFPAEVLIIWDDSVKNITIIQPEI